MYNQHLTADEALSEQMVTFNEQDRLEECDMCNASVESLNEVEINIHKDDELGNFYFMKEKTLHVCDVCEMKVNDNNDYFYNEKNQLEAL